MNAKPIIWPIVLIACFIVVASAPVAAIWAINTLFNLYIAINPTTWLAMAGLMFAIRCSVHCGRHRE
jgi:hypothetical protein